LHIVNSETLEQETVVLSPILVGGSNLVLLGTSTVIASFSIGSVTPKTQTAGGNLLLAAGFTAAGLAAGMTVHNTMRGSSAVIDSISSGVATLTQPIADAGLTTVTANPAFAEDNMWSMGDPVVVMQQPLLNLKVFSPSGGDSTVGYTTPVGWIQDIRIPDITGTPGTSSTVCVPNGCGVMLSRCHLESFLDIDAAAQFFGAYVASSWLNGGADLISAQLIGGASNTSLLQFTTLMGASVDCDAILHGNVFVEGGENSSCGSAYIDSTLTAERGAVLVIIASFDGALLWGPGSVNLLGPNSAVHNGTGASWVNCLKVGALTIEGATTASKYVLGTWTDGVTLNASNLQSFDGLQNPRTGSRFSGP
jgi:hypothetical protein